jgi:hypothetical protein
VSDSRDVPRANVGDLIVFPEPLVPAGAIFAFSNFLIPRTEHLPSQVLPAAGALTNQAEFAMPAGTKFIAFTVTYTRGAAGGYPQFEVLWGDLVQEARDLVVDQGSLAVAGDEGLFNVYLGNPLGPPPITDDPIEYILEYEVPGGQRTVRLLAGEWGQTLTPGTMQITLTGRG